MRFLEWLNRCLGKTPPAPNLEFNSLRADSHAGLELVRLEERIVLNVDAGLSGAASDVLQINLDAANDEATVSVVDGGATIQVDDGLGLPDSIMQFDATQINSILVTGVDTSQSIQFLGQNDLIIPDSLDLTGFTGDVQIGIEIQVGTAGAPDFSTQSTVTYLGQYDRVGDQLNVVLQNEIGADDSFAVQINGNDVEILDRNNANALLFSTSLTGLNSIQIQGADGETDLLALNYGDAQLTQLSISFDGGLGGNDALEFFGGTFDTVTHNLTGPGAGAVDFSGNAITEISYTGLEPVFGGSNTANNVVINLPTATTDAILENAALPGEMQIRSLSSSFELTTFASPADSLQITTAGGASIVELNSYDASFAPTDLILSGQAGDTYQLAGSDLLDDSVALTLSGGATLDLGSFDETVAQFTLEDGTVIATGGILTSQSDLDLRSGSVKAQLNGNNLIKNGSGTVILDALNGYTGSTTVNDGTLQLAQSNAIPNTSSVNLTSATSVLDLNGFSVSLTSLTGTGSVQLGGPAGSLTLNQAISTSATFAGDISGDGSLTIAGAGEVILSGSSTFTGATNVQDGVLKVEGTLATSEVIVATGATLGGSGSISAPVTINADAALVPGSSPGVLSTGDLTLDADADLNVEINGTTAGSEYDQIQVTGEVDLTGATLNISSSFTAAAGDQFLLIDNDDVDAVTGNFVGLAEGTLFSFNGNQVYITYQGGDGNDVVLTVNSPPSAGDQSFSVDENTANTTSVGSIVAADPNVPPGSLSFSLTGGSGDTAFAVSSTGEITVADFTQLDYETATAFDLEILVTDDAGATDTATITININPLNDNNPVIANQTREVDENAANGTLVGAVIVASDADLPGDTLTFTEAGGTGSAAFDITSTGQIIVANQSLLNFENNASYTLDVIVDDNAGSTATATVTINLNDLVESMVVTAGDWSSNDITIIRDGSQLRILETGTSNEIVPSHEFDKVSSIIITGNGSDNTVRLDMSVDTILPPSGISFNGAGGSNTLVSADQTTVWLINGLNSGSLLSGAVSFSNVENLTGNAGADTFTFQDGGQLTGTLSGGDGTDHIDFSAVTSAVTVDLQTSSASGVNLFNTIESLSGDDTQDAISGLSAGTTYLINGVNQGSVSGIDFDGFNHLAGSTGSDTFQFSGSGQITGSIDGLGGGDILDYSASTFSLDLALSAAGATDGFTGSEASTVADFDNIDTIQGSSNTDALAGINAAAVWSLDGTNQYTASNTLNFSDFENLTGGTDVDEFNISGSQSLNLAGNSGNDVFAFADGATLSGTIDGQAGADQIDFSALTSSIDVVLVANGTFDGFQGTEASISGGFDNINNIAAGSGTADKLTGQNAAATWSIQPASVYGSGTSLSFSSFETLQGGNDVDQFNINGSHTLDLLGGQGADVFRFSNAGSALNGTIDGEAGEDHLNLDNYSSNLNVTLSALGGIDGFDGSESAKSVSFANIDVLTGGSGSNTLTGIDSAATWTLNGVNTYNSINTLTISNFMNLTGGSAADIFQVTPNAEAFNIVGGDPTSNPLGDELHVDTSAAGTAVVSNNGDGSGSVTGGFPTVTYSEIENFTITGTVDIELQGTANADDIEIVVNGSDIEYRLGGTLIGTSALSGTTSIIVKGGDGDDSLTIDAALAAAGITVDYDGEGQDSTSPGDVLNLLGTTTSVEYFFVDSNSGSIRIDGAGTDFITYSGLEPITSTINTTNVTLNYSAVAEIITISDAGGGQTTVTSTAGELLTFTNPDGLLTINTGDGADQIELNSLASDFTASLTINGEGAADTLNVNGSLTFDSGKNVELNVESITVANGTVMTAASIALNADTVDLDGDLVAATVSGDAATVNVLGSAGGADIQDAVDVAGTGGIINIAAGVYHTTGTLEIDESVSLIGAGKDVVEIRKAGAPTNTFDIAVNISANNVSISGAQLGWETHTSATDYRGYVVYTNADNTTLNNLLFGDNYRSAVVFEGANNLEVSDSIFEGNYGRAAIRDGDGGSGENFLITRNEFRENHFRWGPIAIGPQGTFGDPNNHAFSGEISFNYFGNGLEAGAFQEAGDQNYTVTITNRGMTADGIDINHNTFDWQDSSTTNSNGIYAQPGGIYFDPSLAVPANSVNITNNIFNGFSYEGPQPSATTPAWDPTGGVFGGALEFDGVDDFGLFQSANFDVGESGTLSFWVNMDDQGRRNQFFEGPNNGGMEFQFRSNSGGQFFGSPNRNDGNGNTYIIQNGGAGGTTGVWQNIQYTWDFNGGVNPDMHLYIDGVEVGYLNGTYDSDLAQWTATVSTINEMMNVGRDPGDSSRFFDGKMDDVGWFDQALGQTDLDTIRTTGVSTLSGDARLVAHWDFDQSSGDIAVDNVSGIQMYLVTDGIVPFGPEFQETAGVFGGALEFDGIDDFATFQDASFDVGRKGTLNFWVKMDETGRRNQFFEGPDNGGFEFQYRENSGGQFYGRTQGSGDYTIQAGGQSVNGGVWTNIQYTWDADSGEMHIYINGAEQPYLSSFDQNLSGFDSTHFTDTVNGLMNVGQDPGSGRFFDGLMDDIGWFNDVLDSTDRATIMNTGVSSMTGDSRLVAHWNLDDPSGTEIVSGDSGTNITLYLQANPPLPPIEGFGVIAPLNANVTYNAFNGNDLDSNVTLDSTNTFGDPLFAYANDPNYIPTDSLATQYVIGFGSSAAYGSSEFAADTDTTIPHIGAFQNLPTVYPGIYGSGDIVVYGTGEDDQLVLTLTGENTATFVLTRDFGGPNELVLASVSITDITSITFNGLGGDDVLIVNQPDNLFFNPTDGITFNGGTQNNDGNSLGIAGILGDTLVLNHSTPLEADSVGYVFTPDSVPAEGEDGVITISDSSIADGSTTIAFTGLEPILDNLLVANRDFDFTDADETISLSDDGVVGDNYSYIDSTLSESVLFLNPTNSITIRTNSVGTPAGVDTVLVNSLDSLFSASLSIFAGADDPVTFQSTVNLGTGELFVTAESVNILADIDAASVEISSSGVTSTTFNGGTVTTTGSQLYHNAVNFVTNTTLTSSGGSNIQFNDTVDGAIDLQIDTAGTTIFNGAIGDNSPLSSLTTNAGGTTQINGGSIQTSGNQIFNDDVELGANTVLTSTGSGAITFNQRLNGTYTLELNTDGDTTFNGTVGDTNELASLTTDANGTTFINGGSIATEGGQLFNDAVLLGANTVLSSSASGSINFKSTLNGAHTLNINTAGSTIFDDQVGNSTPLTSLTTDVAGTTEVNGGSITTTGGQTFHDIVSLGASVVFTSTSVDDITFDQTLIGGNGITIQINSTDDIIFKDAVSTDGAVTVTADSDISGTGNISMETGSSLDAGTGTIDIDGANVLTRSLTTTNGTASAVTIDAHNGNVVTRDNGVNALGDITVNATGSITLEDNGVNTGEGGSVNVQADGDVISTGSGIDTTNGAAAGGNIAVTSNAGQVDLSNGSLLTGDGGSITVNAVTGFTTLNTSLDTTAGTGGGSVEANVSNGTMSITGGDATVNGAGSILLTAKGATSDIQLDTNLTSADGSITLLADNDITLSSTTSILSQASGSITLTADNDGSNVGSITMDSGSRVESQGGQIQISAAGDIALSGITTTGGRVDITSTLGGITDNDSTGVNNVTASQLVLNSNLSIGQLADAIDTAIAFLEADAGTGGLFLDNTGALTIGGISAQDGLDADLDIVIHNTGTLNVTETVQSATGSVTLDATDTLTVDLATTISTLGTGAILLTSNRNIKLNSGSNLKTVNGGITLLANDLGLAAGDFIGVEAENATISTTGTGNILITGFGGADAVTSDHHGVFLHSGATVSSTASGIDAGTITINGTAGEGINDNHGVMIDGAGTNITSADGAIGITGTTDYGTGFVLSDQAKVVSNGAGVDAADITILGTTTADRDGVQITSLIQSTAGAISITGESTGGGTTSQGTLIETTNGIVINENGQITINGTSNGDDGIEISNDAVVSASGTGNIELLGESTGSGSGIHLDATLKSNTGTVTLTAEDDLLLGSVALIDSTSGTVTLTADNTAGSNGNPITMTDGSLIDAGTGTINLTADGDVLLAGLLTTGTVNVDSLSAAISDNGDSHTDIVASTAVLNAVTGIGDGNPLETEISTLSATVSGVGNLLIDNGIAVELLDLSTFDGAITVNNTASLTATSVVSQNNSNSDDNDITLNATGTNSDILVTTISATGLADVMLTADDGILDTNGADSNRITADDLNMSSSSAGGTQDGIDVDTDVNSVTADVNTNAGGLRIDEVDGITLTQLTTFDGSISVNAAGTIEVLDVTSTNNSSSDLNNGITLTATGVDSDILVTSLTAENSADITLNADRDVLDSDSADSQLTSGDLLTIVAGRNIGGITNVFTADGFDPLQTSVGHLDLTSGNQIVIDNTGTTPELINLDAGTGTAGTTYVRATGGALDASTTTGISNTQDTISFISDVSITVPTGLQTANLRLDAPDIIDAGGGAIDVNAVNSILFKSGSAETVNITAQQFDGTVLGSDFVINNDSPALELVDLNEDNLSLTGGTDTNISLSSAGSITVSDLVQTLGTGTLFLETTNTDADLILNHSLLSDTGSVTISTANDILFNGTTNLTSTSGAVNLTADADNGAGGLLGGITMADGTFINAGDGAVSLIASDDIVLSQIITANNTSSAILIDTDSSLVDAGDSTGEDLIANESGARVTIIASLGAGKVADLNGHLETHIDQINVTNQTAGEIRIIETDDLIVHDLIQSIAGDIEVFTTGNILLNGLIETVSDNVLLDSKAAIIDQNDGVPGELNIHATSLDMNAVTGIGTGDTLEMSVDTFSADSTNGDVLLHNTATTGVTATSITTGTGNINLEQVGNESLVIDLATTVDGSITVANTGDAQSDTLTLTSLSAGGATPAIDVSTLNFGNILLGDLVALEGSIAVTSAGEINDAVDDQGAPEVDLNAASGSITLEAVNGIGNLDPIEVSAGTLAVNSNTGDLNLHHVSSAATGSVRVTKLTTGTGDIDYEQTGQESASFEEISTTDSDITVKADGSLLFENPGVLLNVVETDGSGTIEVTATGVNSSIEINDGFSTTGGTIDLTAQHSLHFGSEGDLSSSDGKITLLADSASVGVGGGGITMSDGTVFDAGVGIVDLQAGDSITVGQLMTTTLTRLTTTDGGIVDAGDAGGRDIIADELVIRSATGAGSANALETAVSLLAAHNTDSGNVQIHNDLGGALLTIGTVDGLAGITHSGSVAGDIFVSNASPLTVESPVTNGSGGNIGLESTGPGDLTLNASVRAFGGNGNIDLQAGFGFLAINDTGAASDHSVAGTGVLSGHGDSGVLIDANTTMNSETGAIAGLPPDLRNILTPQIQPTGLATVTGDFGRFTEQNFFITIDWGDGTVETFNFSDPGSFVFEHTYTANPDAGNPAADIPILVTMQGDKQFTFSDGNGTLDFTSEADVLETPGEGLATVAIDTTPQVPQLIFPQQEVILDASSLQQTVFSMRETQLLETAINEANRNAERLVFLRILAPNGDVIEDVPLQESDLDNLPKLFSTLPDGRYQIYLKEAGEERVRLLMDVDIRNGKASDVTEEQSNPPTGSEQQPSTNNTINSQLEDQEQRTLSFSDLEQLTTIVMADAGEADLSDRIDLLLQILIDETSDWQPLLTPGSDLEYVQEQPTLPSPAEATAQLETSEKAWGSAALLSGYFHGRSLFRKPVTQNECESAMEKYGSRLLNRRYKLNRRQK
ncbi:LamG-like jellyroll fold domain-containing protein [Gimesia chilikensis]|uniref:LamG-like jellyroll fold domain-containing protein n=1 Tax=Gimesia chilikensis TaxID=2605989 RepID=UPI00118B6214|nr:LamG-like jellyroll fold domain-containing protein [Gimesia chilikensis]QDT84252.1 Extracellular serine protease precursor [Gimesia chilikensis]